MLASTLMVTNVGLNNQRGWCFFSRQPLSVGKFKKKYQKGIIYYLPLLLKSIVPSPILLVIIYSLLLFALCYKVSLLFSPPMSLVISLQRESQLLLQIRHPLFQSMALQLSYLRHRPRGKKFTDPLFKGTYVDYPDLVFSAFHRSPLNIGPYFCQRAIGSTPNRPLAIIAPKYISFIIVFLQNRYGIFFFFIRFIEVGVFLGCIFFEISKCNFTIRCIIMRLSIHRKSHFCHKG